MLEISKNKKPVFLICSPGYCRYGLNLDVNLDAKAEADLETLFQTKR